VSASLGLMAGGPLYGTRTLYIDVRDLMRTAVLDWKVVFLFGGCLEALSSVVIRTSRVIRRREWARFTSLVQGHRNTEPWTIKVVETAEKYAGDGDVRGE
jgi:hypothetical protein